METKTKPCGAKQTVLYSYRPKVPQGTGAGMYGMGGSERGTCVSLGIHTTLF